MIATTTGCRVLRVGSQGLIAELWEWFDGRFNPHWVIRDHESGAWLVRYPAGDMEALDAIKQYRREQETARRVGGME